LPKPGEALARGKVDSKPFIDFLVSKLDRVKMIAVTADDVDAIEAVLGDAGDQVDRERDVNDLLLPVRSSIALKKLEACDMAVRTLHREESPFPRLLGGRSGVESSQHELVGPAQHRDERPEGRIAQRGAAEGSN